jgi:4-amino-4-deoxy-L-arabinose transferase-like glycosyltransferase
VLQGVRPLSQQLELAALGALVLVAALIRLPYLWSIPQFTDETADSLRSFSFYEGQRFPLHNVSDYVGGLYNWLEAGGFVILGANIYTPRLVACILGAAALATTYLLAREMIGGPAAWLAVALMATSAVHIGGNSHIAWSQETTPLFLALALALLYRAVRRHSGPSLLGAGFVFGLTLQTHPTAVVFLLGAAAYFLWKGRSLLRTRWPYLAAGLFLVAYGNMIVYNVSSGFQSLKTARSRDAGYSEYRSRDLSSYLAKEGHIVLTLLRMPGGAVDARLDATAYLADPQVLGYAGFTLAGVVMLARAGNPLPALTILGALLILPLFGARHDILPRQGRYLAPLLPILFTALAAAAWSAAQAINHALVARGLTGSVRYALGLTAAMFIVALPLGPLNRYYAQSVETGETNDRFFDLLANIEASRQNHEFVVLDRQLEQEKLGGGGNTVMTLNYMLTLRGIPHGDVSIESEKLSRRYGDGPILIVLGEKTYRNHRHELSLEPILGRSTVEPPAPYGVYRLKAS